MPTTFTYSPRVTRYKTGSIVTNSDVYKTSEMTFNKPPPVKRAKPVDLFRNATARRVTSSNTVYTVGASDDGPYYTYAPASYWGSVEQVRNLVVPSSAGDFAALDNQVRLAIKDQNVNLAQALAEYKQTANLFLSAARDIIGAFQSLRNGRMLSDFIRALSNPRTRADRQLANRWLQYQYGWRPLMNDVFGSAEALAKILVLGKPIYVEKRIRQQNSAVKRATLYTNYSYEKLWMKCRARYVIRSAGLKTLSETGVSNPLSLAWEVIPYSFVFDWFIPVGDYLSGLDALNGVEDLVVLSSYRYEATRRQVWDHPAYLASARPSGQNNETITERFNVRGSLSFGRLSYEPSVTKNRLISAVALIRQLKG